MIFSLFIMMRWDAVIMLAKMIMAMAATSTDTKVSVMVSPWSSIHILL